jgi:serralysin
VAINEKHFCNSLTSKPHGATRWDVGALITTRFLSGDLWLQQRVRKVAEEWTRLANLTFVFQNYGPTDIRIAFFPGNGSWSYLGTTCRAVPEPQPTMNFGWLTPESSDDELRRVVLHQFGHALGLVHEHQKPRGGMRWNRDAVIKDLGGPPNYWTEEKIEHALFANYGPQTSASPNGDPLSIMRYPIPESWTDGSFSSGLNGELSAKDKALIARNYPK